MAGIWPPLLRTNFYPRPPRGGRHQKRQFLPEPERISIHALREEGDQPRCWPSSQLDYFYPRPPRGGRPYRAAIMARLIQFLSTPSARRATQPQHRRPCDEGISIHALREEGDGSHSRYLWRGCDFYPRPPRGGRPQPEFNTPDFMISIHALREEGDPPPHEAIMATAYFYPRPPRGGRRRLC